jgi:DNA polymerase-3 subunit delta'
MDNRPAAQLSHAYLITSPSEKVRLDRAAALAEAMVCRTPGPGACGVCRDCRKAREGIHPDVISVERGTDDKGKKRREIYVDQIRDMIADAYILPNEAARKVYLIKDAGYMNPAAQNAILKLLEEPPSYVSILLLAENAGVFLETVRSRCVEISLNAEGAEADAAAADAARQYLAAVAGGDAAEVLRACMSWEKLPADQAAAFVACAQRLAADMLCRRAPDLGLERGHIRRLIGRLDQAAEYLRMNVGVKHVLGMLAVKF